MIQILAIHIFQKLISFNLYNTKGLRKDPGQVIDDRIINSVQQCKLVTKYLAKSSSRTEFHKSCDEARNDQVSNYSCKMCERKFKCQINITLHIYWHTLKGSYSDNDDSDLDDPSQENESDTDDEEESYKFVASPGWVKNFNNRHNLGH